MQALLQTAERISDTININNYVFQRHVIAYKSIPQEALRQKAVLELGCGNGYGMNMLAPDTSLYLGIDKKEPSSIAPGEGTQFMQLNLKQLSTLPSQSFDTIICFQVIEHIQDDIVLLLQIKRILKPGGRLFLTTPNKLMSLTRNPFHIREYTPETMHNVVGEVFQSFSIKGVSGNAIVQQYYEANKAQVARITKLDIFNLQYRLPRWMLQVPYNLMNNVSRLLIYKKENDLTATIHHTDFHISEVNDKSLDFFVVAEA